MEQRSFFGFRGWFVEGLSFGDGSKGGRTPFDPVSIFKALILQAQHNSPLQREAFSMLRAGGLLRFNSGRRQLPW